MYLIALYIVLILLGFLMPYSKKISVIQLIFLWFIFWYLKYPSDLENYEFVYNMIASGNNAYLSSYEPIFTFLMKLCSSVGADFTVFRMVIGTISFTFLYSALTKYTKNIAFALSLCFVFPSLPFGWIMRASLSSSIVVFAFGFLIKRKKIWYIAFIILATFIHYSAIFYLAFLILDKDLKITRLIAMLLAEIAVVFVYSQNGLVPLVSLVTTSPKVLKWFRPDQLSHVSFLGFLFAATVYALLFFLTKYMCMYTLDDNEKEYALLVRRMSIIVMFSLPFIIASEQFIRLLYGILPLVYCACANMDCFKQKQRNLYHTCEMQISHQFFISIIFVVWACFYFNVIYSPTGYTTFSAMLNV